MSRKGSKKKPEERKKGVKAKAKDKTKTKDKPKDKATPKATAKQAPPAEPRPKRKRSDINTKIYRNLFKFLEGKISTECFVDIHEQCYGKADCECECHSVRIASE